MSLTLSAADVDQLQATMRRLLAPLEHHDANDWRRHVAQDLCGLLDVDSVTTLDSTGPEISIVGDGHISLPALEEYSDCWYEGLEGDQLRRAKGLLSWTRHAVWPAADVVRTSYYHDFCVPNGNRDSAGMVAPAARGELAVYAHSAKAKRFAPNGREALLLRLLQPCLAAGAQAVRLTRHGNTGDVTVDALPVALAIFTTNGRLLHANAEMRRLFNARDGPSRLVGAARRIVAELSVLPNVVRANNEAGSLAVTPRLTVRGSFGRLEMHGTIAHHARFGSDPVVLILASASSGPPNREELQRRFALTPRQAETALLIASGKGNREIAELMGVSEHTVRHHTESVLQKTNSRTRAEVAARLRA